jgi:hypothetical protein
MPRLTIRLDEDLLSRLELFAQGRSNGHGPEVSSIVREALECYLKPRPTVSAWYKIRLTIEATETFWSGPHSCCRASRMATSRSCTRGLMVTCTTGVRSCLRGGSRARRPLRHSTAGRITAKTTCSQDRCIVDRALNYTVIKSESHQRCDR